jgi:hypothetical protein
MAAIVLTEKVLTVNIDEIVEQVSNSRRASG